ncbi:unnamed protein product [Kluyveromyces dobzhanskii CBS 2104]|uniref:Vacuolar protein sorting-associated protein 41 n=1 Tax=Kluyveromyces dobzhanskii CBS 2104 TaxID=1427455 RepID=A0A0A8LB84_9SACH|nr:unnamed protein product [Kluyveromyces dobzhanskii CBS 2104]
MSESATNEQLIAVEASATSIDKNSKELSVPSNADVKFVSEEDNSSENEYDDDNDDVDDDSDDDDSDSDEDDDDDNKEPPLLTFTRMTQIPKTFFQRDSISACLFSDSLFAFATHSGFLHLTKPDFKAIRTFKCHRSSILSITTDGEYFATGSIDGTVVVGSIDDPQDISGFDFKRPIHSVVLDKNYVSSKTFASGGMAGEVILTQRNWLGKRTDTILDKNNGSIVGIYTLDDVIFWMNDNGVTFYSSTSKAKLLNIPFPLDEKNRPDLYWPKVTFPEVDRVIICWGNHIWQVKISIIKNPEGSGNLGSLLSTAASSLRGAPDRKVELEHQVKLNYLVAGAATFKDDQYLCLGINQSATGKLDAPELKVIDILNGEELHNYQVVSKSFQNMSLNDYHLGVHIGDGKSEYYLVSSTDAIISKELSLVDRFNWYVDKRMYLKAWQIGDYAVSPMDKFLLALKYIDQLLAENNWQQVADAITEIFEETPNDSDELLNFKVSKWGMYVLLFVKHNQTDVIADEIPISPVLDCNVYTAVLSWYLENKLFDELISLLNKWSSSFYDATEIIDQIEEKLQLEESPKLRKCLVVIYLASEQYIQAISQQLILRDPAALDVLLKHNLISNFISELKDIVLLPYKGDIDSLETMELHKVMKIFKKSIELLVENRRSVPIEKLIDELSGSLQVLLFLFLRECMKLEPLMMAPYEDNMIVLYQLYDKPGLLGFLKSKSNYNVEKVIELCQEDQTLYNELIFLLSKIGENRKALSLIIDRLDDPKLAFQFVKDSHDNELWNFLINYSLDRPKFIKAILDTSDLFEDEIATVVEKIPDDIEVNGLKASLENITVNNELKLGVMSRIFKIVDDETKEIVSEFLVVRKKGKTYKV